MAGAERTLSTRKDEGKEWQVHGCPRNTMVDGQINDRLMED